MRIILLFLFLLIPSISNSAIITLTAQKDTTLNISSPDSTSGATSQICFSYGTDNACLFSFDLTGISINTLISAELQLWGTRGYQHSITISRLLRDFTESQATWNVYSTGNSWTTPGAKDNTNDYTSVNSIVTSAQNNAWLNVNVTQMVKDMITGGTNTFLLRATNANMYATWATREDTNAADHKPKLVLRTGTPGTPVDYYIRPNGGTCTVSASSQCDGLTDADYPGSGTQQACACSHPKYVWGDASTAGIMAGEDRVHIKAGTYTITSNLNQIPSGSTKLTPTQILGEGWDTTCTNSVIFNVTDKDKGLTVGDNTEVNCLKITDTNGCSYTGSANIKAGSLIDNEPTQDYISCNDSAAGYLKIGLKLANNATGFYINNVKVYGASYEGVEGYGIGEGSFYNFHVLGAGSAGWNADPAGTQASSLENFTGPISWINSSIKYAGCGLRAKDTPGGASAETAHNCVSQDQGGYGDGFGMNGSSGSWTIINSEVSHNVSDGFDFLYGATNTIRIDRLKAQGNAGAAVKSGNPYTYIENSVILDNCTGWQVSPHVYGSPYAPGRSGSTCVLDGKCAADENYGSCADCIGFNVCRADAAISINMSGTVSILNSTLNSSHSLLIGGGGNDCTNSNIILKNNVAYGAQSHYGDGSKTTFFYQYSNANGNASCPNWDWSKLHADYNTVYNVKNDASYLTSPGVNSNYGDPNLVGPIYTLKASPVFVEDYISHFYPTASSSTIRDVADETVTLWDASHTNDVNNYARGASWDRGGIEYGSTPVVESCSDGILNQNETGIDCGGLCTACAAVCGNGTREGTELCDGSDMNSQTCVTLGFSGGSLSCNQSCSFITTSCNPLQTCGNGVVEGTEECDLNSLNGQTCVTQGYTSGDLTCSLNTCTFNVTGCANLNPVLPASTKMGFGGAIGIN